jgi:hypothetical protein
MATFLALHLELPEGYPPKPRQNLSPSPMPCLPHKIRVIATTFASKRLLFAAHLILCECDKYLLKKKSCSRCGNNIRNAFMIDEKWLLPKLTRN